MITSGRSWTGPAGGMEVRRGRGGCLSDEKGAAFSQHLIRIQQVQSVHFGVNERREDPNEEMRWRHSGCGGVEGKPSSLDLHLESREGTVTNASVSEKNLSCCSVGAKTDLDKALHAF